MSRNSNLVTYEMHSVTLLAFRGRKAFYRITKSVLLLCDQEIQLRIGIFSMTSRWHCDTKDQVRVMLCSAMFYLQNSVIHSLGRHSKWVIVAYFDFQLSTVTVFCSEVKN